MTANTFIRTAAIALFASLLSSPAVAQDKPAVLMMEDSMTRLFGARSRLGFERQAAADESPVWKDPDGRLDSTLVSLAAGGGMIGFAVGDAHAQRERDATIQPLIDGVTQGDRLKTMMEGELRASVESHGYVIQRTLRADGMSKAHVYRGLTKPSDGLAIVVQQPKATPMVALSWDDRQPLLAFDLYFYERWEGKKLTVREKSRRSIRYVGYQAPAGQNPRAYWAANDAAAFVAEVQTGLRRILPLAWDTEIDVPKVPRKETTTLQIDGAAVVFFGRLWKQENGMAYLFNQDDGITVVATAGVPVADAAVAAP
jgi:hypothetical protein